MIEVQLPFEAIKQKLIPVLPREWTKGQWFTEKSDPDLYAQQALSPGLTPKQADLDLGQGRAQCWYLWLVIQNPVFPLLCLEDPDLVRKVMLRYFLAAMEGIRIISHYGLHPLARMADDDIRTLFVDGTLRLYRDKEPMLANIASKYTSTGDWLGGNQPRCDQYRDLYRSLKSRGEENRMLPPAELCKLATIPWIPPILFGEGNLSALQKAKQKAHLF